MYYFMVQLMKCFCPKSLPALNANMSPSGSFPTLGNWVSQRGKNKLVALDEDLETYFDNIGRYLTKNYLVSAS